MGTRVEDVLVRLLSSSLLPRSSEWDLISKEQQEDIGLRTAEDGEFWYFQLFFDG